MWNTRLSFGEYVLKMSSFKREVDVAEFLLFISYFAMSDSLPNESSPIAISRVLTLSKGTVAVVGERILAGETPRSARSRRAVSKWKQP